MHEIYSRKERKANQRNDCVEKSKNKEQPIEDCIDKQKSNKVRIKSNFTKVGHSKNYKIEMWKVEIF